MSDLNRLKFARQRLLSELEHSIANAKGLTRVSSKMLIVCKDRTLQRYWDDFQKNVTAIVEASEDMDDADAFFEKNQKIEDDYHDAKVHLDTILPDTEDPNRSVDWSFFVGPRVDIGGVGGGRPEPRSRSHLPDIKLKSFDGNYNEWQQFSQLFEKMVAKEKLDAVDKMYYLNQSLKGEPVNLVKHLSLTEDSFERAWQILKDNYDIRRHMVNAQFELFFGMKKMQTETASELRNMLQICLECESAFEALQLDAATLGVMMVYYCSMQMDAETAKQWALEQKGSNDEAKLCQLVEFLQTRCRLLTQFEKTSQSVPASKPASGKPNQNSNTYKQPKSFLVQNEKTFAPSCTVCGEGHRAYQCPTLLGASVQERRKIVVDKRLCFNCLYKHKVEDCRSRFNCSTCKKRHNTILHCDSSSVENVNTAVTTFSGHANEGKATLLATACVPIYYANGNKTIIRALIDQGSTANFISENVCQLIGAQRQRIDTIVTSINDSKTGTIKSRVDFTIGSIYDSEYRLAIDAMVLPRITSIQAISRTNSTEWPHILGLQLADPKYMEPGDIDLLIGARVYAEIILNGLMKGPPLAPIAQLTRVGWILSGACESKSAQSLVSCNLSFCEEESLSQCLQRFWELEKVENRTVVSNEDELCERSYADGVSRADDGKLMVRLPFKVDPRSDGFLGDSYQRAYVRLLQLERRLSKNRELYDMYRQVLNEYIDLQHMREATPEEISNSNGYFLPHHAVVKMDKTTSKVRVVFDASCKSSNGKSLNDLLMVGPTIQDDLFSLILRWRKFRIAYTGDIEKMYRQFWVHHDDVKFQRILWRNNPSEPVKQYVLLTVTFGTASAPFQAIRSLHEIANRSSDPEIAHAIRKKFYVDDFLSGKDTVAEAQVERQAVSDTLREFGLNITKWKSNSAEFQNGIPNAKKENVLEFADATCKALGILWQPSQDVFTFKLTLGEINFPLSKRKIVSEVAKLFDPLGWLAPSIVLAKLVIQQTWVEGVDWDAKVSPELQEYWLKVRKLLFECDQIQIERWVGMTGSGNTYSIHGFSDASERAYAAVVYMRTEFPDGTIRVNILAAKSKIAPLQKVTLPRLELCGAVLLAKLIHKVTKAMELENIPIHAYSDSTIVLNWLKDRPIRWTTFVANRVSEIQEIVSSDRWRHVISQLNPADCASRGLFIDELRTHDLWWHGPAFLKESENQWPTREFTKVSNGEIPEQRKAIKLFHVQIREDNVLLMRFDTLTKLLKVTAYIFRWKKYEKSARLTMSMENAVLSVEELEDALMWWVRMVQRDCFPAEYHRLLKGKEISGSSSLLSFAPSLAWCSKEQIIRVGGRLKHANLDRDFKHPIILPSKHRFTWLVISDAHKRMMHGGPQQTLQFIRQRFWVIHGRVTVSAQLNRCVRCARYKKQMQKQFMGNLPEIRTKMAHPFQFTGVDFAGYFEVKQSTRRNAPYEKCYVSVFVCMVTKAIHLEVVKDLSTDAFLDAYRCFTARRGIPDRLYSDRGTNFIGAHSELPNLLYDAKQQQTQLIINELLNERTEWHFNPAHSPHFGGLFESGVKSMKFHLRRVLHQAKLTEHQFRSVITQIEACLNSRPLCSLTEDPEDLEVLTPGHFLIGRSLKTVPEPTYIDIPENRLKIYQYLQRLMQDFWKQWHAEYLQTLQKRSKWTAKENNVAVGQLVLLRDENLPPSRWLLGRITKVIFGSDQLVRVVEVKCKTSILTRSIHKLCLLPTEDNNKLGFEQMELLKRGEHVEAAIESSINGNENN